MKKLIIFVIVFAMVAIGITAGLIITKNDVNNDEMETENKQEIAETAELINEPKEKTINLYGTYEQNNLKTEEIEYYVESEDKNIKILQIKGLKNKSVENKINNSLKEKAIEAINSNIELYANFSNVISSAYGNYRLTDGEKIELEDLFTKDTDLRSIVRMALYRDLLQKQRDEQGGNR